ncbi:MAG: hypothetical protein OS130_14970 [Thermodesulfobacteriota bacterium]|jgi:hypothetical protein|nr:MAG: hypothetical protein OS130_14970 [Thermodesulfobacteriota bacterium]
MKCHGVSERAYLTAIKNILIKDLKLEVMEIYGDDRKDGVRIKARVENNGKRLTKSEEQVVLDKLKLSKIVLKAEFSGLWLLIKSW